MIIDQPNILLFIHPRSSETEEPIIDRYSVLVYQALSKGIEEEKHGVIMNDGRFVTDLCTLGRHTCRCGADSESVDYQIAENLHTNTLAVHYLVYHRSDVPQQELDKIDLHLGHMAVPNLDEIESELLELA